MLRVIASALKLENNRYSYQETLFNGIAFYLVGDVVDRVCQFVDGVNKGDYVFECLAQKQSLIAIDADALESEYETEPFLFQEKLFSGVAYDFDRDRCVEIALYQEGFKYYSESWYYSGELGILTVDDTSLYQDFLWYLNGSYQQIHIKENNFFYFKVKFTEEGLCTCISIEGSYFDRVSELKEQLKVSYLQSKSAFSSINISSRLHLSGDAIDDELLTNLRLAIGFSNISNISLYETSISPQGILQLIEATNLQELSIDDSSNKLADAVYLIKKTKLPNCLIQYNDNEINP